jgi:hypothetical protein
LLHEQDLSQVIDLVIDQDQMKRFELNLTSNDIDRVLDQHLKFLHLLKEKLDEHDLLLMDVLQAIEGKVTTIEKNQL